MLHAAMKIMLAQKWQLLPVAKIKGKSCFRWSPCTINYISACKSQMAYMGLDFESDKPRISITKIKTIPCDMFIPANRDKTSHVNEIALVALD